MKLSREHQQILAFGEDNVLNFGGVQQKIVKKRKKSVRTRKIKALDSNQSILDFQVKSQKTESSKENGFKSVNESLKEKEDGKQKMILSFKKQSVAQSKVSVQIDTPFSAEEKKRLHQTYDECREKILKDDAKRKEDAEKAKLKANEKKDDSKDKDKDKNEKWVDRMESVSFDSLKNLFKSACQTYDQSPAKDIKKVFPQIVDRHRLYNSLINTKKPFRAELDGLEEIACSKRGLRLWSRWTTNQFAIIAIELEMFEPYFYLSPPPLIDPKTKLLRPANEYECNKLKELLNNKYRPNDWKHDPEEDLNGKPRHPVTDVKVDYRFGRTEYQGDQKDPLIRITFQNWKCFDHYRTVIAMSKIVKNPFFEEAKSWCSPELKMHHETNTLTQMFLHQSKLTYGSSLMIDPSKFQWRHPNEYDKLMKKLDEYDQSLSSQFSTSKKKESMEKRAHFLKTKWEEMKIDKSTCPKTHAHLEGSGSYRSLLNHLVNSRELGEKVPDFQTINKILAFTDIETYSKLAGDSQIQTKKDLPWPEDEEFPPADTVGFNLEKETELKIERERIRTEEEKAKKIEEEKLKKKPTSKFKEASKALPDAKNSTQDSNKADSSLKPSRVGFDGPKSTKTSLNETLKPTATPKPIAIAKEPEKQKETEKEKVSEKPKLSEKSKEQVKEKEKTDKKSQRLTIENSSKTRKSFKSNKRQQKTNDAVESFANPNNPYDLVTIISTQFKTPNDPEPFLKVLHCLGDASVRKNDFQNTVVFQWPNNTMGERLMLEHYSKMLMHFGTTWIVGHNIIKYDIPYLFQRMNAIHKSVLATRAFSWFQFFPDEEFTDNARFKSTQPSPMTWGQRSINRNLPQIRTPGIVPFDTLVALKVIYPTMETFSLKEVAKVVLEGKINKKDVDGQYISPYFAASPEHRRILRLYCEQDVNVTWKVVDACKLLLNVLEVARVSRTGASQQMASGTLFFFDVTRVL